MPDNTFYKCMGGGGVDSSDATATANDILLGKTAYVNDEKITGLLESGGKFYSGTISDFNANSYNDICKTIIDKENIPNKPKAIFITYQSMTYDSSVIIKIGENFSLFGRTNYATNSYQINKNSDFVTFLDNGFRVVLTINDTNYQNRPVNNINYTLIY